MDIWQSAAEMVRVTSATREGKASAAELSDLLLPLPALEDLAA